MTVQFRQDLTAIRAKLSGCGHDQVKAVRPAFGHRAGFDAFMTGYAFGCYAVELSSGGEVERLEGLEGMKNRLASRVANWKVPLHILKSHFAKTSSTHAIAKERMKETMCTSTTQ